MLWYAIARQNSNFFDVVNNNKRDSGNTLTRRLARYSSGQCRHMPCYIHVDVWASLLLFLFFRPSPISIITTFKLRLVDHSAVLYYYSVSLTLRFHFCTTYTHTMSERVASVERTTSETHISCTIDLDHIPGVTEQKINVSTGIGFLDHVRVMCLCSHFFTF